MDSGLFEPRLPFRVRIHPMLEALWSPDSPAALRSGLQVRDSRCGTESSVDSGMIRDRTAGATLVGLWPARDARRT